jgi:hypothetical protein
MKWITWKKELIENLFSEIEKFSKKEKKLRIEKDKKKKKTFVDI